MSKGNAANRLTYNNQGLVPVAAQDAQTGELLMLAWANREAIERTIETGFAHFWSRSRECLWRKGDTSGNQLRIEEIRVDCDEDALLFLVTPSGPACHTGAQSCFYRCITTEGELEIVSRTSVSPFGVLGELTSIIGDRASAAPDSSYTARLLAGGVGEISRKIIEEAFETCLAAWTESDTRLAEESADLLYHLLVLLESRDLALADVCAVLAKRRSR